MGTSTFLALNIGVSSLQASQMGVQVAGNNIANAQTAGYARETLNQGEISSLEIYTNHTTYLGQGVLASNATRVSDPSANNQYRYNTSKQSYWSQMNTELSNLQQVYNEPSGGAITTATNAFFSAWNQLSQNPSDSGVRAAVLQSAQNLVASFNQVSNALQSDAGRYQAETTTAIDAVNTITQNIASLNKQIQSAQQRGDAPNNLLDQRSALLDKLSQYVQIDVTSSNNVDNVTAVTSSGAGISLVSGSSSTALTSADISSLTPQSGQLTAYSDLQNQVSGSSGLLQKLSNLETQITGDVNAQQTAGLNSTGVTGLQMFTTSGGGIVVNPAMTAAGIAASTTGTSAGPTNGENARKVSNLLSSNGYMQTYASDLSTLGSVGSAASSNNTTFTALQTQAQNVKTSISGVDINQEMASLVQYQQTYSAASKFVSVFNQMLTTLIQNT